MLKMVVSDLDGTLINGESTLPENVAAMIKELKRRGILFAVASGRKICELKNIFSEFENDIIFIACDGAYALYRGETILKETIDKKIINCLDFPFESFSDKLGDTVKIIAKSKDIKERTKNQIKINRMLSKVYDDFGICEFVKYGVNKGTALSKILNRLLIKPSEVLAFGDNLNDKEMLKLIPKSYAAGNAKNEIKQICRYETQNVCETVFNIIENTAEVRK